jgi:2-phosphosulfolactate phosphatase
VKIAGYHMGNSPREFARQVVGGKRLVMCTTNGTRAIRAAWGFRRMLIGSFLNGPTLARCFREEGDGITILCAGREGSFSLEDTLCAGMLLSDVEGEMSDGAVVAASLFEQYRDRLEEVLLESEHGRFLQRIGFTEDVVYCARVGITQSVPEVSRSGEAPPYDLFIKRSSVKKNDGEVTDD